MTTAEPCSLPVAVVLKVFTRDRVRMVKVHCPYCPKRHTHGWPPEHDEPGVRLDHCGKRPPGVGARLYRVTLQQGPTR